MINETVADVLAEQTPPPERDALAEYLALRERIAELDAVTREAKKRMDAIEQIVIEDWAERGRQNVKQNGELIYVHRELFVNVPAANRPAVLDAVRLLGMDELVDTPAPTVPTGKLKPRIREWIKDDNVPDEINGLVNIVQKSVLRTRKA